MTHEAGIGAGADALAKYINRDGFFLEVGFEKALQAYLSTSGMVLVPGVATEEMELAAVARVKPFHDQRWYSVMPKDLFRLAWPSMLSASPYPFKSKP